MEARAIQFCFKLFSEKTTKRLHSHTAGVPLMVHINLYWQEALEDSQLPAFQVQIV
jgi:hypothetical protein